MIKIYDTMTRSLREFVPITDKVVNMYVCGPTVYNYIHIGNARSAVAFDTIRRYFEYAGYTVNYISNFTDVDDKIIKAAKAAGLSPKQLADQFIAAFMEDTKALGVKPATKNPRVMDYMDEIIAFIAALIKKAMPMSRQVMFISVWQRRQIMLSWLTKPLLIWRLVPVVVQIPKLLSRKIPWTLPYGNQQSQARFLGQVLGAQVVLAGISSAL